MHGPPITAADVAEKKQGVVAANSILNIQFAREVDEEDLFMAVTFDKIAITDLMRLCIDYDKNCCNDRAGRAVFCHVIEKLVEENKLSQEQSDLYWDCLIEDKVYND